MVEQEIIILHTNCFHNSSILMNGYESKQWEEAVTFSPIFCDIVIASNDSPTLLSLPGEQLLPCGQDNLIVFEKSGENYQINFQSCVVNGTNTNVTLSSNDGDLRSKKEPHQPGQAMIELNMTTAFDNFWLVSNSSKIEPTLEGQGSKSSEQHWPNQKYNSEGKGGGLNFPVEKSDMAKLHRLIENELFEINCVLVVVAVIAFMLLLGLSKTAMTLDAYNTKKKPVSKRNEEPSFSVPSSIAGAGEKQTKEAVSPLSMDGVTTTATSKNTTKGLVPCGPPVRQAVPPPNKKKSGRFVLRPEIVPPHRRPTFPMPVEVRDAVRQSSTERLHQEAGTFLDDYWG